jgi:hypothetical protein
MPAVTFHQTSRAKPNFMAWVAIVLSLLIFIGCTKRSREQAASCSQVAGHIQTLAKADIARASTASESQRHMATEQLSALSDALAAACEQDQWASSVRSCMADAATIVAGEQCQTKMSNEQRLALQKRAQSPK